MADNAFLDKGVILGFCFFTDPHHRECRTDDHVGDHVVMESLVRAVDDRQ